MEDSKNLELWYSYPIRILFPATPLRSLRIISRVSSTGKDFKLPHEEGAYVFP